MGKISFDDPLAWEKISPELLSRHILKGHLCDKWYLMKLLGVPRYDIELAEYRGFKLQDVIEESIIFLERNPLFILNQSFRGFEIREVISRTLHYIEEKDLGKVNWDIVNNLIPNTRVYGFSIEDMSSDVPFSPSRKDDKTHYDKFVEEVLENPNPIYRNRLV